jgi:hypothetical protein
MLVVICGSRDAPHASAVCLPIVTVIVVGRGCGPLRMLLEPLLAALHTLLGDVDGNVKWHPFAVAWDHLPASLGGMMFGRLVAGGIPGGEVAWLLTIESYHEQAQGL